LGGAFLPKAIKILIFLPVLCLACSGYRNLKGSPATDFYLNDLEGNTWSSPDLRERKILLHFWSPDCQACLAQIPDLNAFNDTYGDKIRILSLASDMRSLQTLKPAIEKAGFRHPVLQCHPNLAKAYGVLELPSFVLLEHGKITLQFSGKQDLKGLEKELGDALK
jgi:thiol-disulfide isomerase/thioredoxin